MNITCAERKKFYFFCILIFMPASAAFGIISILIGTPIFSAIQDSQQKNVGLGDQSKMAAISSGLTAATNAGIISLCYEIFSGCTPQSLESKKYIIPSLLAALELTTHSLVLSGMSATADDKLQSRNISNSTAIFSYLLGYGVLSSFSFAVIVFYFYLKNALCSRSSTVHPIMPVVIPPLPDLNGSDTSSLAPSSLEPGVPSEAGTSDVSSDSSTHGLTTEQGGSLPITMSLESRRVTPTGSQHGTPEENHFEFPVFS